MSEGRWQGGVGGAVAALCLAAALAGCADSTPGIYIDGMLQELKPRSVVTTTQPQPLQLIFELQTDGVRDTTEGSELWAKGYATAILQKSGLFTLVSDRPTPNGSVMKIVVNAIALEGEPATKDFLQKPEIGLTEDTEVTGYLCTMQYLATSNATLVAKETRDALYSTDADAPIPAKRAEKMENPQQALAEIVRRLVSNGLNEIAKGSEFLK